VARRNNAQIAASMRNSLRCAPRRKPASTRTRTGRWYVRIQVNGTWTTRRNALDGAPLSTRDQALIAKGPWDAQAERSELVIVRMRFDALSAEYLTAVRPDMTHGAWVELRGHGTKRLLPFFADKQLGRIDVPARARLALEDV
jgi:hypothetical protein